MMRLNNLSTNIEALRNKTELNREMAKGAKALADNATLQAVSLGQVGMATYPFVGFGFKKMFTMVCLEMTKINPHAIVYLF